MGARGVRKRATTNTNGRGDVVREGHPYLPTSEQVYRVTGRLSSLSSPNVLLTYLLKRSPALG